METSIYYIRIYVGGYLGIMEKKMETTIMGYNGLYRILIFVASATGVSVVFFYYR